MFAQQTDQLKQIGHSTLEDESTERRLLMTVHL